MTTASDVLRVIDGDTLAQGKTRHRDSRINAPETSQVGGAEATALLMDYMATGGRVEPTGERDLYGRELSEFTKPGQMPYSFEAVRAGRAHPYDGGDDVTEAAQVLGAMDVRDGRLTGDPAQAAEFRHAAGMQSYYGDHYRDSRGTLERSMARGGNQMDATLHAFGQAIGQLVGSERMEAWGAAGVERNLREAAHSPARIESYDDIESLDDMWTWTVEKLGENLPQLIGDAGAALTGAGIGAVAARRGMMKTLQRKLGPEFTENFAAVRGRNTALSRRYEAAARSTIREARSRASVRGARAGALASIYPQVTGETQMELNESGVEAPGTALVTGLAKTALEYAPLEGLVRSVARVGRQRPESVAQAAGAVLANMGVMAGAEGATEGMQTVLDKMARNLETGQDLLHLTEADVHEIKNAIASGATVGGGIAGVGTSVSAGAGATSAYFERRAEARRRAGLEPDGPDGPDASGAPPAAPAGGPDAGGPAAPQAGPVGSGTTAEDVVQAGRAPPAVVTTREGPEAIGAQLSQLARNQRNAVFISQADQDSFASAEALAQRLARRTVPFQVIDTDEGRLVAPVTFDAEAYIEADPQTRDDMRAQLLGYTQPKSSVRDPAKAKVVVTRDAAGTEQFSEVVDPENAPAAVQSQEERFAGEPTTTVVESPKDTLDSRPDDATLIEEPRELTPEQERELVDAELAADGEAAMAASSAVGRHLGAARALRDRQSALEVAREAKVYAYSAEGTAEQAEAVEAALSGTNLNFPFPEIILDDRPRFGTSAGYDMRKNTVHLTTNPTEWAPPNVTDPARMTPARAVHHEIGHWGFMNVLSGAERLAASKAIRGDLRENLIPGRPGHDYPRTKFEDMDEYVAEMYSNFKRGVPTDGRLIPYFEKIDTAITPDNAAAVTLGIAEAEKVRARNTRVDRAPAHAAELADEEDSATIPPDPTLNGAQNEQQSGAAPAVAGRSGRTAESVLGSAVEGPSAARPVGVEEGAGRTEGVVQGGRRTEREATGEVPREVESERDAPDSGGVRSSEPAGVVEAGQGAPREEVSADSETFDEDMEGRGVTRAPDNDAELDEAATQTLNNARAEAAGRKLYGGPLRGKLLRLRKEFPTLDFVEVEGEVAITRKVFSSIDAAEKEAQRLHGIYRASDFHAVPDGNGAYYLVELGPEPNAIQEEDVAADALARLIEKAKTNAGTALRAGRSGKSRTDARNNFARVVDFIGPDGEDVSLHAPTITEMGERIHREPIDAATDAERQQGFFLAGMAALLDAGYSYTGDPRQINTRVFLRSKNDIVRGEDIDARRTDSEERLSRIEVLEEQRWDLAAQLREIQQEYAMMMELRDSGRAQKTGVFTQKFKEIEALALKAAPTLRAALGDVEQQLAREREAYREETGSSPYDTTAFDKADIEEVAKFDEDNPTEVSELQRTELAFGETREEKRPRTHDVSVIGRKTEIKYSTDKPRDGGLKPRFAVRSFGLVNEHLERFAAVSLQRIGLESPTVIVNLMNPQARAQFLAEFPGMADEVDKFLRSETVLGRFMSEGDQAFIFLDGTMSAKRQYWVLAHEMGHLAYAQMRRAVFDKHKDQLMKRFREDRVGGSKAYAGPNGFYEWFADEYANWLVEKTQVDGFLREAFRAVKAILEGIYEALVAVTEGGGRGRQRISSAEFNMFMLDVVRNDSFHQQAQPSPQAGLDFAGPIRAVGQARARQYMGKVKEFLTKRLPRMLPFLYTVDAELRVLSAELADLFYRESSSTGTGENTELSYTQGVTNARNRWFAQWESLRESMGTERFRRALDEMARADPHRGPDSLSPNARRINDFFQKYRETYLIPNLGKMDKLPIYFPRVYDLTEIGTRREEFEALLMRHLNPPGANPPSPADVANIMDNILSSGGTAELEFMNPQANVFRPGFSGRYARKLIQPGLAAAMDEAGFLVKNKNDAVMSYIASSTKYAEYGRVNRGQRVDRLIASLPSAADRERARKAVEAYLGRTGIHRDPGLIRGMSWVMVLESYTTLLFAAVASIPDLAGPILRTRNFADAAEAFQTVVEAFKNYGTVRERMRLLGLMNERMTHHALKEAYGQSNMSSGSQRLLDKLFQYNGQERLTNFSRVLAGAVGEEFLVSNARKARAGDARAQRYLKELGVSADEVQAWDRAGRTAWNPDSDNAVHKKVQDALYRFVDESIVRPNAGMRPEWASDPLFMLVWHLKTFFWAYGKVIVGGVIREGATRYRETGSTVQAGVPFALAGLMLLPFAALARELREAIMYPGEEDPTEGDSSLKYAFDRLGDAGIWGPFELAFNARRFGNEGPGETAANLLGPSAQHLFYVAEHGADWNSLKRSTPLMNQLPWLNDLVKDTLGVE